MPTRKNQTSPPLGLIGLGLMGAALADRWLAAGFPILGYDRSEDRRAALTAAGGQAAASAAEVVAACDRVVFSLPDQAVVGASIAEAAGSWRAGQLAIDTTTGDPESAVALSQTLAAHGATYLEATISGSSDHVRRGAATVMTAGPPDACARCADLWPPFAEHVFVVGAVGDGARMKLATNLVLGLNRAALAEGLAFAHALGLDAARTLAVLQSSLAYSRIMDSKGPKMLAGDFTPQARLSQHLKDVRLMLAAGEAAGLPLPLSAAHRELLERAVAAGWGDLDNSALIRCYGGLTEPRP